MKSAAITRAQSQQSHESKTKKKTANNCNKNKYLKTEEENSSGINTLGIVFHHILFELIHFNHTRVIAMNERILFNIAECTIFNQVVGEMGET